MGQKCQGKISAPAWKIAGEHGAADSARASTAGTKKAVVVIGYADAQDVAIICKYGRLPGKCDGGIAAVGRNVNKRHTASDSRCHRTEIEIYRPIAVATYVDAAGI